MDTNQASYPIKRCGLVICSSCSLLRNSHTPEAGRSDRTFSILYAL